jgi:hypothetical protein
MHSLSNRIEVHCIFFYVLVFYGIDMGMRDILEICQKCDMKYDVIDVHLSTTIVHINMQSSSSLLLLSLVFLGWH